MNASRLVLAALPLAALAACASESARMESMPPPPAASAVAASSQPVVDETVTIDSVTATADGFVVIHEVIDGQVQAPQSIGHAPVKAGTTGNVPVRLDQPVAPGSTLLAMLHGDTGTIGVYEFGPGSVDNDKPVVVDGKPVVVTFSVE
jgi:hypothetical protein